MPHQLEHEVAVHGHHLAHRAPPGSERHFLVVDVVVVVVILVVLLVC